MNCPTCGSVPDRINNLPAIMCHTCGTVVIDLYGRIDDTVTIVPRLVERCREFHTALRNPATGPGGANLLLLWYTEGIAESINLPENRK